jgi:hypothetical protein
MDHSQHFWFVPSSRAIYTAAGLALTVAERREGFVGNHKQYVLSKMPSRFGNVVASAGVFAGVMSAEEASLAFYRDLEKEHKITTRFVGDYAEAMGRKVGAKSRSAMKGIKAAGRQMLQGGRPRRSPVALGVCIGLCAQP